MHVETANKSIWCSQSAFSWVRDTRSLVFWAMFCRSMFVILYFFFLAILLSVLIRFTVSDYPFGIFNLFFTIFLILSCLSLLHKFKSQICLYVLQHPELKSNPLPPAPKANVLPINKRWIIPKGHSNMDNSEKLWT